MVWPFSRKKVIDLTEKSSNVVKAAPKMQTSSSNGYADLTSGTDLFSAINSGTNSNSSTSENLEVNGLKNKIDDIEYKVEALRKKLNDLLDRFEVVEKKFSRNLY